MLHIGQKVRLISTGEVGVVVWLWQDEYGDTDTYVAFWGEKFPEIHYSSLTKPDKPYILRYYAAGLESLE